MKTLTQRTGLIVLFGILVGCSSITPALSLSPTQTQTSEVTAQPTADSSLELGNWHDMIYHESIGQVVLINGGPETGKDSDDPVELWTWDGSQWMPLSADENGPRWRNFASVTYDSNRDVLVLYGGLTNHEEFQDTWEWDGIQWTQVSVEGLGPREGAGMTYDAINERVVLFGGAQSGKMMNDLWEWDGIQWDQISTEGPNPRFPAGFVYDLANDYVLLFGGHSFANQEFRTYGDTWIWDGTIWKQIEIEGPSPRDGARVVSIPMYEYVFLFGGAEITNTVKNLNDTWLWDGMEWEQVDVEGPPARVHPAMAFDSKRGVVVMTGGSNGPNATLSDTWEWNGQAWFCVLMCWR